MSIDWMNRIWKLNLPTNKKFVLLAHADHAAPDGTGVFPSVRLVADKTGYSERQVQRLRKDLSRYLVPDGFGPKGTARFRLQMPYDASADPGAPTREATRREAQTGAAPSMATLQDPGASTEGMTYAASVTGDITRTNAVGVTPGTSPGDNRTAEGATPVSPEPSLTIIEPPIRRELSRAEIEKANAQVTAMISTTAKATYPNRDRIPEAYLDYADNYNALTGQVPTKRVLADWISTFSTWQAEGILVTHVRQAIEASRGRFTVVRPGSLTDTAAALRARATVSKGKGEKREWSPASVAEFQFKIDRSRRITAEWYRSRGIAFEDPDLMQPRIEDIPRLLSGDSDETSREGAGEAVRESIGRLASRLRSRAG